MKLMLGVAAVAGAIGVWAGFNAWQSAAVTTTVYAGLAVLAGGNLFFCSWLRWRAQPGSGDAMVLPTLILLSAAMLIGILPRLLWPAAEVLHIAGSVTSALIATSAAVVQIRKRRRLRKQMGSV
jgi:hypothetical protein